ncbi:MAG: hypothetical protein ACRDTP_06970, partial [Mycobacteriales bacterium]
TQVFGNENNDSITFDQTYLGGNTRVYGSDTPTPPSSQANGDVFAPAGDGEDTMTVYLLQSMTPGQSLTLDGQDGTDHYVVYTHGTAGVSTSYLINALDTGAPGSGSDTLDIYGLDSSATTGTDDIFLLRAASYIPGETSSQPGLYDHPAYVSLLHPSAASVAAAGGDPLAAVRSENYAGVVERINYDNAINGRLSVYGLGGNDYFAVDDNAAPTTLDGGDGADSFQIGQVYGMSRSEAYSGLPANDYFPTIATTRGYLSRGTDAPLVAEGGNGNDTFTVYSNQSPLRLEGDAGNDMFLVQAFALAETYGGPQSPAGNSTNQGELVMGPLFTGVIDATAGGTQSACASNQTSAADCGTITSTTGSFIDAGFRVGQTLVMKGSGSGDDNTAATAYTITAISSDGRTLTLNVPLAAALAGSVVSLSPGPLAVGSFTVDAASGTITRTDGGNFNTDGFIAGQTIALSGTGTADDNLYKIPYVIQSVSVDGATLTLSASVPLPASIAQPAAFTITAVLPTPLLTNGFS